MSILNDDCWRYILDFVSVKDIVRSERVSRQWQALVRWYLQDKGVRFGVHNITNIWDVNEQNRRKCTVILAKDALQLNAVLNKWGPSVVELVYDARNSNGAVLSNLASECPNLEDVTFVRLNESSSCAWIANYKSLKRICFENCTMPDVFVSEFLKNNSIEELVIRMTESVDGSFLQFGGDLKNLKTLILSRCSRVHLMLILKALEPVNYLTSVTRLELRDLSIMLHMKVHLILDKMPQLEHLTLDSRIGWNNQMVAAISRLKRLQYLGWCNGHEYRGDDLQAALKDATLLTAWEPTGAFLPCLRLQQRGYELYGRLAAARQNDPDHPEPAGAEIYRDLRR